MRMKLTVIVDGKEVPASRCEVVLEDQHSKVHVKAGNSEEGSGWCNVEFYRNGDLVGLSEFWDVRDDLGGPEEKVPEITKPEEESGE